MVLNVPKVNLFSFTRVVKAAGRKVIVISVFLLFFFQTKYVHILCSQSELVRPLETKYQILYNFKSKLNIIKKKLRKPFRC